MTRSDRVLGLDGCSGGWVVAVVERSKLVGVEFYKSVACALKAHEEHRVCAMDIPIGLTDTGHRCTDTKAREMLGERRSSVFNALPKVALRDDITREEASEEAKKLKGPGISPFTWGLAPKTREVARLSPDPRRHEVHPEVSFHAMAGQHNRTVRHSKKTWNGLNERLSLLTTHGLRIPDRVNAGKRSHRDVGIDDVVDAVACAWSARRIAEGSACWLGSEDEARIWY